MNPSCKESAPDSLLVLLPGSDDGPEAVQRLGRLSVLDPYMIRNRLRSRLPVLFWPCRCSELLGESGDGLTRAGIRWMVVSRQYLEAPFQLWSVATCMFDEDRIRLYDAEGNEQSVPFQEPVLMLEAVYESDVRRSVEPGGRAKKGEFAIPVRPPSAEIGSGRGSRVIFLFQKEQGEPIRFVEEEIDFSFLGEQRAIAASLNFKQLAARLEARCGSIRRDLVTYRFAIEASTEERQHEQNRRPVRVRTRSNVSAVHTMARLFRCQWWKEMGWADRRFPP